MLLDKPFTCDTVVCLGDGHLVLDNKIYWSAKGLLLATGKLPSGQSELDPVGEPVAVLPYRSDTGINKSVLSPLLNRVTPI